MNSDNITGDDFLALVLGEEFKSLELETEIMKYINDYFSIESDTKTIGDFGIYVKNPDSLSQPLHTDYDQMTVKEFLSFVSREDFNCTDLENTIIKHISEQYSKLFKTITISQLKGMNQDIIPFSLGKIKSRYNYDDLTIENFLILYRIHQQLFNRTIDEDKESFLVGLLFFKITGEDLLNEAIKNGKIENIKSLENEVQRINRKFRRYNINGAVDLREMAISHRNVVTK